MSTEITDEIKAAEAALGRALAKFREIPSKERSVSGRFWTGQINEVLRQVKMLKRHGLIFDLIYSQRKKKK